MNGSQSDRQRRYRSVLGSRISLTYVIYFFLSLGLDGATATAKQSDAELSRALIGSWEIKEAKKSSKATPLFVSVNADGTFKLIRILDFSGYEGRQERQGKWRIKDGRLITQTALGCYYWLDDHGHPHPVPHLRYGSEVQDKISLQEETVILQTKHGEQQMHKAAIPSRLPPLVTPDWWAKLIVDGRKPDYPIEARRLYLEGDGFFKLSINEKTGAVASVQISKSTGHKILDDAAIRAFKTWRFKPETMQLVGIPIRFTLTGKPNPEKPIDSLIPSQSSPISPEVVRIQRR